ncbi:hypothetical protein C8N46_103290 [Kordia periserrulae]|uniref:Uncharacterized protein n=1 Tax=Kordia periserrulae TaxID=701523 RepID=A0A2T6C1K8_9FLAO|nr:hypothetical protein C8N46_103290 [Kordia periserrulae]
MSDTKKFVWKKMYTVILVANLAYILLFYFIMNMFS